MNDSASSPRHTWPALAATDFQHLLQHVRVISHPELRVQLPLPETVLPARRTLQKRSQMLAAFEAGKHRFSAGIRTSRSVLGSGVRTRFCETNPNGEKRDFVATDCKPAGYLKTTWRKLTVPGAKRSQMRRFNPKTENRCKNHWPQ